MIIRIDIMCVIISIHAVWHQHGAIIWPDMLLGKYLLCHYQHCCCEIMAVSEIAHLCTFSTFEFTPTTKVKLRA